MDTYNVHKNNDFYYLVKIIINDKDARKIIYQLSEQEIYSIGSYLDNKMYYLLLSTIDQKNKSDPLWVPEKFMLKNDEISRKLIGYHELCLDKNLDLVNILLTCKYILIKAGGKNKKIKNSKNIIMSGITLTLRSILDQKINTELIDNNLRLGALERKRYIAKKYHLKTKVFSESEPIFDKNTPVESTTKQNIISEVSINPNNKGKHMIHNQTQTKHMSSDTTIKNYDAGAEIIKNLDPVDPLDKPLSVPLDEPPVGKSGATLIIDEEQSVLKKMEEKPTVKNNMIKI